MIKSLKQQVADLQSRTSEITACNKEIAALTKSNAILTAENKKLTDSLNTAQKENTTLNTKLAAARSSVQPEQKVPGSAMKARTTGVVLPGSAEAAKDAMLQKQKVEMYCDLTNLVIVGVKKNEDDEDVYDCLQTGRNGSKSTGIPYFSWCTDGLQHCTSILRSLRGEKATPTPSSFTSRCSTSREIRICWTCCPTILLKRLASRGGTRRSFFRRSSTLCQSESSSRTRNSLLVFEVYGWRWIVVFGHTALGLIYFKLFQCAPWLIWI